MKLSSSILRLAALPLLAAAFSPSAHAGYGMQVHGRLLDLGVYDRDSQQRLPVYWHDGRYYVAGVPGHRYELTLRNRDGEDLLVVPSVDGVNAYTGETADWSQGGYVLDGYANYDLKGWRKSLSQVAGFVFADASRSYAARTGRPANVGVIGMAVFRRQPAVVEVEPMPMPRDRYAEDAVERQAPAELARAAPAPAPMSAPAAPPPPVAEANADAAAPRRSEAGFAAAKTTGQLGTGFGRRERDDIHLVDFERASSQPDEVVTVYYDTYANLMAQGIVPARESQPYREAQAFPGQFVPDPPGG